MAALRVLLAALAGLAPACALGRDSPYFAPCQSDADCAPFVCDAVQRKCVVGEAALPELDASGAALADGLFVGTELVDDEVVLVEDALIGTWGAPALETDEPARVDTLTLHTPLPYGAGMPKGVDDDRERADFPDGGLDMSGIALLLPMDLDDDAVPTNNGDLDDASPGQHFSLFVDNGGGSVAVPGVVGNALFIGRTDWLEVTDAPGSAPFDLSAGDVTMTAWVRISGCDVSESNCVALGGQNPHMWIGASCPEETAAFVLCDDVDACVGLEGPDVVDGAWHHIVGTRAAGGPAQLYVDGRLVASETAEWSTFTLRFDDGLFLGNFPLGTRETLFDYESELALDEVALFRRGFTPDDVRALFERGAGRVQPTIRVCTSDQCEIGDVDGERFELIIELSRISALASPSFDAVRLTLAR